MNNGCCSKCQAKSKKTKKSKNLKEESDEETEEQKKVSENENPKTDSKDEKESEGTSDDKDTKKKKKNTLTWQHSSTMKEKGHDQNNLSEKNGVKPSCFSARPMMYHGGGNPSNLWPRGGFRSFSRPPMYGPYGGCGPFQPHQSMMTQAPMYGPYGSGGGGGLFQPYQSMTQAPMYGPYGSGGGGLFQPYQSMTQAPMHGPYGGGGGLFQPYQSMTQAPMHGPYGYGVNIPPYPPMAAPALLPYGQNRPFTDANPTTRYTSYRDNYSFGLF